MGQALCLGLGEMMVNDSLKKCMVPAADNVTDQLPPELPGLAWEAALSGSLELRSIG